MDYKNSKIHLSFVTLMLLAACAQEDQAPSAEVEAPSPVDKALAALGGAEALQGIASFAIESTGSRFELDEHLMPGDVDEIPVGFTSTTYYDVASDGLRVDITRMRPIGEQQATMIINGQVGAIIGQDAQFGPSGAAPMTSDRWAAVLREHALLNAHAVFRGPLGDGSVTAVGDELLDGVNHHILVIEDQVAPVRLYVNADTGNIAKLTTMETDHLRRDVPVEVMYENWAQTGGGVAFPNEVTMTVDGEAVHSETRSSVMVNTPLDAGLFELPEGVTPTYDEALADWGRNGHQNYRIMASIGFPRSGQDTNVETEELAPGVHHVRGASHHSLVVEQEGGVVVAEAPMHELRSGAVIEWIENTFPGKPVTHVIATHHHTDHTAGLRAYVGGGATAVVHEAAESFFTDIFDRPSALRPDALHDNPATANIETMPAEGSYTIADANLSVEIFPVPNDHSADMVMIHVPAAGVVFVSDIYSPNPAAPAGPGGQAVQAAIEAAGIDVSIIAGGHGAVIDYATFQGLLGG